MATTTTARGQATQPAAAATRRSAAGLSAYGVALVSVACTVATVALYRHNAARTSEVTAIHPADVVLGTLLPLVGALIVARQPRNRVGWVVLTSALLGPYLLAGQYAVAALVVRDDPSVLAHAAAWLSLWGFVPYWVLWGLGPLLFPDGRLPSRRWRPWGATVVTVLVVGTVARMFAPTESDASNAIVNPLALDLGALNYVTFICAMASLASAPVGIVALYRRMRAAHGAERAQLQWLVLGMVALIGTFVASAALPAAASGVVEAAGFVTLCLCIAVAAARHGLFDVEVVLNRTIVFGVLTGLVLVAYVAAVAAVGELATGRRTAYALIALIALIGAAARDQVQALVDRYLFGARSDPYELLSRVSGRLDFATGPVDAIQHAVDAVREALKLPYVAVRPLDERLAPVTTGRVVPVVEELPVKAGANVVGILAIGHRHPGERFTKRERTFYADLAQRLGTLLLAAQLTHEVQVGRELAVATREEERRRLRRDIHDGIGPVLAGMAMQVEGLAERLEDPALAERAQRLQARMRETVTELRRIVDDLRPHALDDLGLRGALAEHLATYSPIAVLDVPAALPVLPAAVEAAAYRIVAEAVANAVRHSGCTSCVARVVADDGWLDLSVADDGQGLAVDAVPGVGLRSMRERAAEVGGRFDVSSSESGTTVRARLPIGGDDG
jgi:signal transduction histidine kinase